MAGSSLYDKLLTEKLPLTGGIDFIYTSKENVKRTEDYFKEHPEIYNQFYAILSDSPKISTAFENGELLTTQESFVSQRQKMID